ncbi:glycoside hydrolase family 5 protein (plasmid) [Paenibacillus rhizovicinus]|uniref:Glycoside hydrolase family 5 protein n=1 Tax=Paenibacillus rhizovicinus TaxID=2704463 RepID=A0A6C0PCY3_9BACL|nr:glycoside hydrolase family 5 protein [Paenibacillus rhizovicinus]QHW35702.1 glycoside hydrolase family 5 protein [Paenibacillus rhizovicinus]
MHPLQGHYARSLDKPYAAVKAIRKGKRLIVVPGSFFISRADTMFISLPDDYQVVSEEGKVLPATGSFMISAETFDPYHVLVDYQQQGSEANVSDE